MKGNKNTFVQDRDRALFSLNESRIRAFYRKYNISASDNPLVFWASIYKAVLGITGCPENVRKQAEGWLDAHGFHRGINMDDTAPESLEKCARHTFEHVVFPCEFYRWGDMILNQVIDGDRYYMSDLYNLAVECGAQVPQPYKANFFKVITRKYVNGDEKTTIVRLDLPKPTQITECRRIYLCRNEETNALMYFTSELSMKGTYYLCAWTKQHSHLLLDMNPAKGEFDNVEELFREFAGYEPSGEMAV